MKVVRLRVPVPIAALGHVNSYILSDEVERRSVLVDPGMYWPEGISALGRSLSSAGLRICDVEAIVITHFHVDHATATAVIASLCPMPVYMGERDLRAVRGGFERYFNGVLDLYSQYGVPVEELETIRGVHPVPRLARAYEELADMDLRPLREGDRVTIGSSHASVVELPGHTPGHIALVIDGGREALVGDSLLNRITPHVVLDDARRDALGEYIKTLRKMMSMGLGLARPGHMDDVVDPAGRAAELLDHHDRRLNEVRSLLSSGPLTLYDVARRMRWRTGPRTWSELNPYERYFAIGEALAHLRRLVVLGEAEEVNASHGVSFRLARP